MEILAPLGPPIVIPVHNIRTTSALIEWEEIPHAVQYKLAAWSRDDRHYGLYLSNSIALFDGQTLTPI